MTTMGFNQHCCDGPEDRCQHCCDITIISPDIGSAVIAMTQYSTASKHLVASPILHLCILVFPLSKSAFKIGIKFNLKLTR